MALDDDADCVEHVWALTEVVIARRGADQVDTCQRCGAVNYEPSPVALRDTRPPL